MGEKTGVMIRTAIQALLEADARLAEAVLRLDDEIDDMNRAVQAELIEVHATRSTPSFGTQALKAAIIAISRSLPSAQPTTPPTSPKTSSSGSAAPTSATGSPSPKPTSQSHK